MENKNILSTKLRPFGERTIEAPMVAIDIQLYADELKSEIAWKESDRNAITLYKSGGICILLIALRMGMHINIRTSYGFVSIQVMTGEVVLTTDDQTLHVVKGQMIVLQKGMYHKIEAMMDTEVLVTEALTIEGNVQS